MSNSNEVNSGINNNKKCEISAKAFIKIICHSMRYKDDNLKHRKNICAYGFLIGMINENDNNNEIVIKDIEALNHHNDFDLEFDENLIKDMDDFNQRFIEEESSERVIGWYKTIKPPLKFRAIDVKNQLKFQSLNPGNICLLFDYDTFSTGNSYGFSIFSLKKDRFGEFNFMSEHNKIPWTIKPLGSDKDNTISYVKNLINLIVLDKELITELDEN